MSGEPMSVAGVDLAERFASFGAYASWTASAPQQPSMSLNVARVHEFTGELTFRLEPEFRLYLDAGVVYHAEMAGAPSIGEGLLGAGVVDTVQLKRGMVRVGDVEHLGRLFERDPSIDRSAVLASLEGSTATVLQRLTQSADSTVAVNAYRHHPSGIHRWFVPQSDVPTAPRPSSGVTQVDRSVVEDLPVLGAASRPVMAIEWTEPDLTDDGLGLHDELARFDADHSDWTMVPVEPALEPNPPATASGGAFRITWPDGTSDDSIVPAAIQPSAPESDGSDSDGPAPVMSSPTEFVPPNTVPPNTAPTDPPLPATPLAETPTTTLPIDPPTLQTSTPNVAAPPAPTFAAPPAPTFATPPLFVAPAVPSPAVPAIEPTAPSPAPVTAHSPAPVAASESIIAAPESPAFDIPAPEIPAPEIPAPETSAPHAAAPAVPAPEVGFLAAPVAGEPSAQPAPVDPPSIGTAPLSLAPLSGDGDVATTKVEPLHIDRIPQPDAAVPDDVAAAVRRALQAIESASSRSSIPQPTRPLERLPELTLPSFMDAAPVPTPTLSESPSAASSSGELDVSVPPIAAGAVSGGASDSGASPVTNVQAAQIDPVGQVHSIGQADPVVTNVIATPPPTESVVAAPNQSLGFAPPTTDMRAEAVYERAAAQVQAGLDDDRSTAVESDADHPTQEPGQASVVFVDDEEVDSGERRSALRRLIGSLRNKDS